MFKLIAATVAVLYAVLWIFGGEERRVEEVARMQSDILDVSVTPLVAPADQIEPEADVINSSLTESEAVQIAMKTGEELRAERSRTVLRGARPEKSTVVDTVLASASPASPEQASMAKPLWYVTGTRVNLRAGPSTGNDVVGRLSRGAEAEVLGERDGWYQIKTADGSVSGWIYGEFLTEQRPG